MHDKKKKKLLNVATAFGNTSTKVGKVPEGASNCVQKTGLPVFLFANLIETKFSSPGQLVQSRWRLDPCDCAVVQSTSHKAEHTSIVLLL